ncbi:MAG: metallophosphoesterase [Bacteroidales bacterium]
MVVNPQLLFQMNGLVVFILFIALVIVYTYKAYQNSRTVSTHKIRLIYGIITFLLVIGFLLMWQRQVDNYASITMIKNICIGLSVALLVSMLITVSAFLLEDIVRIVLWIKRSIQHKKRVVLPARTNTIRVATLAITVLIVSAVLYGVVWGFSHYKVHYVDFAHPDIPTEFDGFTIAQISDTHLGTFGSIKQVQKGLDVLQQQNPDMVVFTGDMVNNKSEEAERYISMFAHIKAPYGKFAVLGNHDYAHYAGNLTEQEQHHDVEKLRKIIGQMGFEILENEHRTIIQSADTIQLVGVENWGLKPFPQYGDLDKSMQETEKKMFTVLLSHDPSHWRHEIVEYVPPIELTLSGHTHGMQFGFEIGDTKWSPIQYRYSDWAGLFEYNNRYLYVNRGFGGIGFPARIGIRPEITVIRLQSEE